MKERKAGTSICNEFPVNKYTSKRTIQQFQVRTFIFIMSVMNHCSDITFVYYSMQLLSKKMINVNEDKSK